MAVQIIINKRNKAALAKKLSEEGRPVDLPLGPNYRSGYGIARTASEMSELSDGDGGKFAPQGLEDGTDILEMDDKRIVNRLYELLKEKEEKKENYWNLLWFLVFVTLYMTVLYLQTNTAQTFMVNSSFGNLLPGEGGYGSVTSAAEIYEYLNTTIITPLWADPVCGDGICDKPIEFPGFGRFGCIPDCGAMPSTPVTVELNLNFDNLADEKASSWNLCMTYPSDLCWFAEEQRFSDQTGVLIQTLNLPNGTWEMHLTSPHRGLSGNVKTDTKTGARTPGSDGTETLVSWGGCVPDVDSDLLRCRSICAQNALCAAKACENLQENNIPSIFIGCTQICNANATMLDPYQNITCLQSLSVAANSSASYLGVANLTCTLDETYLAANPEQVAKGNSTDAPTPTPSSANTTNFRGGTGRRLNQATSADPSTGNATLLYWNKFGSTNRQRYSTLATALARALQTWAVDACLCPYSFPATKTGPPMLSFFCAYFGGPPTLPGCVYEDKGTGRNLTSADLPQLEAVLASRYGPGGRFNISQAEQNKFITILLNAIESTVAFDFGAGDSLNLEARLHYTDTAVVALPGDTCNSVNVVLPWKNNVHQTTNISAGDSIQWTWQDDLPHALLSLGPPENESSFTGLGTGSRILSRTTLCTPQNILSYEDGTFTKDPVPCIVGITSAGNVAGTFSYTKYFNTTGTFAYTDKRYTSAMTGIVTVKDFVVSVGNNASTNPTNYECAPKCQIKSLNNGLCDTECNNFACRFDGGDCACPDASSVAAASKSSLSSGSTSASTACTCPGDQIAGPDGACCQGQEIGENLMLPFDIVLADMISESIFDPANFTRTRYATNHNRILGGLFLYQTRSQGERCKEGRFSDLLSTCIGDGLSTEPFGADPVFNPTSDIYNPLISLADYYKSDELSPLGNPYGFFPRKTEGQDEGFPLLFDINLDQSRAQQRLQYLTDGLFLDNGTDVLTMRLITYNGVERQFADMTVHFSFQTGGTIAINSEVSAVGVEPYVKPVDYFRACLEILVAIAVIYDIIDEIVEAVSTTRQTGSLLSYFTFYNIVDATSLVLMFSAIIVWIVIVWGKALPFKAIARYDIYEDLTAEARFFGLKTPTQFDAFATMAHEVTSLVVYRQVYVAINGLNIFLLIIRIFKLFDFQPKMGVITRSLELAADDLANFFVLWGIFFVGYAFMGFMIFGRSVVLFRTFQWSLTSCFLMILGDTAVEYNLMQLNGWELAMSQVFFYSYNIGMITIVMQFLVAIAVDAFAEVKERTSETAPGMLNDLADIGQEKFERVFRNRYSDKALVKKLKAWRGKVEADDDKANMLERTASGDAHGEMEKKLVLKLDADEIDKEKLETVFERRCTNVLHAEVNPHVSKVADQILAEFGEEVIKKKKKKKVVEFPTMKKDMKHMMSEMKRLHELVGALHSRFDDIQDDMAHAGIRRSTIAEGREGDAIEFSSDQGNTSGNAGGERR